jgi:hypothetical protein
VIRISRATLTELQGRTRGCARHAFDPGSQAGKNHILHKELSITNLAALETAAREERLKSVKGLGAAVQRKILEGLKIREHAQGARHLHRADELAISAAETLQHWVTVGCFVAHCHIINHEDIGMMQRMDIRPAKRASSSCNLDEGDRAAALMKTLRAAPRFAVPLDSRDRYRTVRRLRQT